MITVENTKLSGVKLLSLELFNDHRGEYVETYNEADYRTVGVDVNFVQDDYSISKRNVLRGLHGDSETWKLIMCPVGELMLAVVNCDATSSQFGRHETFLLNENKKRQVLIPPYFANGHLVLSERAMFWYKQSTYYQPEKQFSLKWDDPSVGIEWPVDVPILSDRDKNALSLEELKLRKDASL